MGFEIVPGQYSGNSENLLPNYLTPVASFSKVKQTEIHRSGSISSDGGGSVGGSGGIVIPPNVPVEPDVVYQVDADLAKSMFAYNAIGNTGSNVGIWKSWVDTTIATYQGTPEVGSGITRAYPFEADPANPEVSSPWHNIIYEWCIGPYLWGARAMHLHLPFGSFDETFFLTAEIYKRTLTSFNEGAGNHLQPAMWKGFKYAVKALLEGTLAPDGKTPMTDPCNVSIYHTTNRGYELYRQKSNAFWDSLPGSTAAIKDQQYYEHVNAWVDDLIFMQSSTNPSAGRLYVTMDATQLTATPEDISQWRTAGDYRTDALELVDWHIFNRLLQGGVAVSVEARTVKTRVQGNEFGGGGAGVVGPPLPVLWDGKAISSGEYWFWFSNPTHPVVDVDFANFTTDENLEMVVRFMEPNFPIPTEKDPYGITKTASFGGQTKTFVQGELAVNTPQYAMFHYYVMSDHYRKAYNSNTSTNTFTDIKCNVKNIMLYNTDFFCGANLTISVYGSGFPQWTQYRMLPGSVVTWRPLFNIGTAEGEWNHVDGVAGYTGGYWTPEGIAKWDSDVRDDTFAGFITKLHNFSLAAGPIGSAVPYGSGGDPLTNEVVSLVRTYTDIFAASWVATDPAVAAGTHTPELLGEMNTYPLVVPLVHVYGYYGDGGYDFSAAGAPQDAGVPTEVWATGSSLGDFIVGSNGGTARGQAIHDKLMLVPEGKRVYLMTRYNQANWFRNVDDQGRESGLQLPWADVSGAEISADASAVANFYFITKGSRPDQLLIDGAPGEFNPWEVFSILGEDAIIDSIVDDAKAEETYFNSPSFNDLYTYADQGTNTYPLDFANIRASIAHPQQDREYLYWNRAVTSTISEFINHYLIAPLLNSFGITKATGAEEGPGIVREDTFLYNGFGHPYMSEIRIGDASGFQLYGAWLGTATNGVGISNADPTKLIRTDQGGTTPLTVTAWNQLLLMMQTLRGAKRVSPSVALRPTIGHPQWLGDGGGAANPQWSLNGDNMNLYWESVRHAALAGTENFFFFNYHDIDAGNQRTNNCIELNAVLTEINDTIGGYTLHATNISRISFLADYIISGAPTPNEEYVWRVTPKPGVILLDTNNDELLTSDDVGGKWVTTPTATPPVYHT